MRQNIFLICFFLTYVLCNCVNAQELFRTVSTIDYTINSSSADENTPKSQILRSLALNNGMSLKQVQLRFEATVFVSFQMDSSIGQMTAITKILNKRISGPTHFRGFTIDSLLMPSEIWSSFYLMEGTDTLTHFKVPLRTDQGNKTTAVLPDNLLFNPDSIMVIMDVKEVSYHAWKWAFDEVTELINLYYAYNEILKELIAEYGAVSLNRKQGAVNTFMAWHQISRVNAYSKQHRFIEKLHLNKNDPQKFLDSFALSKRMETRAATLSRQLLKTNKRGKPLDKLNYCEAYTMLSLSYLKKAEALQPYLAGGFEEVAAIFPSIPEKKMLQKSAHFFDVFNRIDQLPAHQLIYNNFVDLAQQEFDEEKFVRSLQLLKNAALLADWFKEVLVSNKYSMLYQQSLEGVMISYLKVSVNAYKLRKYQMADRYYQNAMTVFEEYGKPYLDKHLSYLKFTEQQIELAEEMLLNNECQEAFALLELTQKIRGCKHVYQGCPKIDSLLSQALQPIWAEEFEVVDDLLDKRKFDMAKIRLDSTFCFTSQYQDYIKPFPDQEFLNRGTVLFDAYFELGEGLLKSNSPEKALAFFLQAQEVEQQYLPDENTYLKILVYNATVPVILNEIEKSRFETWANRMLKADSIYRLAKKMQVEFQQEDNPELQQAFAALEVKMEQRKCMSLRLHLKSLNNLVEKRVQFQNYELAEENLNEALGILVDPGICEFESAETEALAVKYAAILHYKHLFRDAKEAVLELEYDSAIVLFVSLSDYYLIKKLDVLEDIGPELYSWVASNKITALTTSAANYYLERRNYLEAFRYLNLLKIQGASAQDTKGLQQQIGNGVGLIALKKPNSLLLQEYSTDDKWFRYFRAAKLAVTNW